MSSTQKATPLQDINIDKVMMETPDSPPIEAASSSAGVSSLIGPPPDLAVQNDQQANTNASRSNGDNAKVNHGAPGSTWSSKKFHDDYNRAMNSLVDQNWDHTKYGDPLLQ